LKNDNIGFELQNYRIAPVAIENRRRQQVE